MNNCLPTLNIHDMNYLLPLSTFIINLKVRTDRKENTLKEFADRDEFKLTIVEACEHENGAIGLWNSITYILRNLVQGENHSYFQRMLRIFQVTIFKSVFKTSVQFCFPGFLPVPPLAIIV